VKKPLILHGGVDINPALYGQKPLPFTQSPSDLRDERELRAISEAMAKKQPIVGICRGAQLLCAFHGGTLIQHSIPLGGQNHQIMTKEGDMFYDVPASHHQIMKPAGEFEILAWNPTNVKMWYDFDHIDYERDTPEVVWWPKFNHLGIQPHPEWDNRNSPWVKWVNKTMYEKGINYEF
jgi:anthranilate/para-aminobenzoate synthase component II